MGQTDFTSVRLVIGDSIVGDDKGTGTLNGTNQYYSFGASDDLWGTTPTSADINAANFGVVVSFTGSGYIVVNYETHYLKATNFGFSIPGGATIDGIVVEVKAKEVEAELAYAYVDHIRITVYYTEVVGINMQINISDVFKDIESLKINIGNVWKDVVQVLQNIGGVWKNVFG